MNEKTFSSWSPVLALLMLVAASIACNALVPTATPTPSQTEQNMVYANALRNAVDSFEASRNEASSQIAEISAKVAEATRNRSAVQTTKEAVDDQKSNDTVIAATKTPTDSQIDSTVDLTMQLSIMWEAEWLGVHTKFKTLSERFNSIGVAADNYFQQLDDITESITDPQIKTLEQEKNRQLREKWDTVHQQAAADLAALGNLINRGDDFEKVIQLYVLRASVGEGIVQLQEISTEAQRLLKQMEQLTVEGRKLITGDAGL